MSDAVKDAAGATARPVAGDGAAARDPWTPEQRLAIEARGRNLLVSAAAGSGKTSVLVRRVIERMLDPRRPVDIDRMLVVTFTEAAAAEMRDRIRRTLEAEMEKRPADMRLRRQVGLLARASISTLHAFCLTVIRQYHYRIDLDPGFQVIDDHEALLLRQDVLEDVLEARYAAGGEAFRALVDAYGRRDDETLRQFVLDLHDLAVSQPWPDAWLDGLVARFDEAAGRLVEASPWMEPLRALARREAEQAILHVEEALRLCALPGGPADRAGILETDRERLREVAQTVTAGTWEEIRAALAADWPRFTGSRDVDPILLERVQKHRKRAKDRLERLSRQVFHSDAAAVAADLARMRALAAELVDLVRAFGEAFAAAKAELGVVDFADMERLALRVLLDPDARPGELRPSPAAKELRERFDEVLVDEYQDINEVQDAILRLVARDGEDGAPNLFMVGDVKQSIYRFRLAEPGLFLRKYATFPPLRAGEAMAAEVPGGRRPGGGGGTGGDGPRDARIDLNANFRSRPSVVDAVNFVFRQLMTPTAGGIAYDESAQLVAAADYPEPDAAVPEGAAGEAPVEVHLLERRPGSEPWPGLSRAAEGDDGTAAAAGATVARGDASGGAGERASHREVDGDDRDDAGDEADTAYEDAEALEALEREALLVARRIRALVHGEAGQPPLHVWDKDLRAYRPVRHRDIVVLLRSVKWKASAFAEMLAREGVPVYTRAGGGYFATMEIELMLALLAVIDNPRQDIALAAVLRSPVVGLGPAELAAVRLSDRGGDFYDAVCAAARAEGPLGERLRRFLGDLERWRTAARRGRLSHLVEQLYRDTGFLAYASGLPGGEQRRANLLALLDRARQFDTFARQGLYRFLRFVERLREREADLGPAPALGEHDDVVRVMTIHQSKGLEFPVVIVADLGAPFQTMKGDLFVDRDLGLGFKVVDTGLRIKYPSAAYWAVRERADAESLREELRIFYVALTRARERLILIGSATGLAERAARWLAADGAPDWALPDALVTGARAYLDWVGLALIRHPDGRPLRELALADGGAPRPDASRWTVRLWRPEDLGAMRAPAGEADDVWRRLAALEPVQGQGARAERSAAEGGFAGSADERLAALERRLAWSYPYAAVTQRFAKRAVTEIKGPLDPERAATPLPAELRRLAPRAPRFLESGAASEGAGTAAQRGTAVHAVLQHLDLRAPLDAAGILRQVDAMVARAVLTEEEARLVDPQLIARFFDSDLGRLLRAAPERVRRELMFTLELPARRVYPDLPAGVAEGETVLVQGVMDCLVETDDGLLLLDFKTDDLRGRPAAEAAERYRTQVELYREAAEAIFGRPVTAAYLYFLSTGEAVRIEPSSGRGLS